jgi:hypothetical protein
MQLPESADKGAGGVDKMSPMERFRKLTKGLLDVPVPEIKEAERLYQQEREMIARHKKMPLDSSKAKPAA